MSCNAEKWDTILAPYAHDLKECEPSNSGKSQWRCASCEWTRQIRSKAVYDPCPAKLTAALSASRAEVERLRDGLGWDPFRDQCWRGDFMHQTQEHICMRHYPTGRISGAAYADAWPPGHIRQAKRLCCTAALAPAQPKTEGK